MQIRLKNYAIFFGFLMIMGVSLSAISLNIYNVDFNVSYFFGAIYLFIIVAIYSCIPSFYLNKSSRSILIVSALFMLFTLISAIYHNDLRYWVTLAGSYILFLLFFHFAAINSSKYWEMALWCSVILATLFGIGHYFDLIPLFNPDVRAGLGRKMREIQYFSEGGYTGLLPSRGSYGIVCLLGLTISTFWIFFAKGIKKNLGYLSYIVIPFAMFITGSRSTWLALAVFLISVIILKINTKKQETKVYCWLFIILFLIMILVLFYDELLNLFYLIANLRIKSIEIRMEQFRNVFDMELINIFFGNRAGGGYKDHVIHNAFIAVYKEYGVISFVLFCSMLFILVRQLLVLKKLNVGKVGKLRLSVWLICLFSALIELFLYRGYATFAMWIMLGLIAGDLAHTRTVISRGNA